MNSKNNSAIMALWNSLESSQQIRKTICGCPVYLEHDNCSLGSNSWNTIGTENVGR